MFCDPLTKKHCSYRFTDLFPDAALVRDMQKELDAVIQQGVVQITRLLKNLETGVSSGTPAAPDEDEFDINSRKQNYLRGMHSAYFPCLAIISSKILCYGN